MVEDPPAMFQINEDVFREIFARHWQQVYVIYYNYLDDSEIA